MSEQKKSKVWTDKERTRMTSFLGQKMKEEKDAGVKGKWTKMVEGARTRRMAAEN